MVRLDWGRIGKEIFLITEIRFWGAEKRLKLLFHLASRRKHTVHAKSLLELVDCNGGCVGREGAHFDKHISTQNQMENHLLKIVDAEVIKVCDGHILRQWRLSAPIFEQKTLRHHSLFASC